MTSPQKAKGSKFERDVLDTLTVFGVRAHRTLNAGIPSDVGDILTRRCAIQCKNHARLDLAGWVQETIVQASRTGRLPVVVHKRKGHGNAADAYATLPVWALAALIERAEAGA